MTESLATDDPGDRIASNWFTGQRLLLTGASGFVGKALLEKILWASPGVERVFVLLRARDSRGAAERLGEILAAPAFHRLRSRHGSAFTRFCREKLVAVAGDVTQEKLGASACEYQHLAGSLTAIVHAAACVNFDARWDVGLEVNTLGPLRVLRLAQDAGNIPFVHLSTCYVSGNRHGRVDEELAPLDPAFLQWEGGSQAAPNLLAWVARHLDKCRAFSEAVDQGLYDVEMGPPNVSISPAAARRNRRKWLTRRLAEQGREQAQRLGWNDAYTLTKALGEHLLVEQRGAVPLRLVRPSIIGSTFAEPSRGWLVGIKICDPVILALAHGLGCFVGNPGLPLDMIPCDLVVNATLAVLATRPRRPGVEIYQIATSEQNPLRQEVLAQVVREAFQRFSLPMDHLKAPVMVSASEFDEHCAQLCATLPLGQKGGVDRYRYYAHLYSFYTLNDFCYTGSNTRRLFESLSAKERRLYPFDVTAFDWRTYFLDSHLPGLFRLAARLGLGAGAAIRNSGAAEACGHAFALPSRPMG
jgi:fatty acyl-CoA reductase